MSNSDVRKLTDAIEQKDGCAVSNLLEGAEINSRIHMLDSAMALYQTDRQAKFAKGEPVSNDTASFRHGGYARGTIGLEVDFNRTSIYHELFFGETNASNIKCKNAQGAELEISKQY